MTDGEPEPFRMSTGPDATDEDAADAADVPANDEDGDEDAPLPGGVESIADLISEASRTAAEQAVREATGTAPVDRSSDVWGSPADDEDLDSLWSAAADRHRGSHVFDDVLGPDDDWQRPGRMPPPAADPTVPIGDDADDDDEPAVFKITVDDEHDEPAAAADEPAAAADEPAAEAADEPAADPPGGAPPQADDQDGDDPEVFRFAAGPATTAPAAVPDHVPEAGRDEPDMFAFAFDEATGSDDDGPSAAVMQDDDPADDAAAEPTTQEEPVSEQSEGPDDDGDVWAAASPPDDDASDLWAATAATEEPAWGDQQDEDDALWSAASTPDAENDADDAAAPDDTDDGAWTFDVRDDAAAWGEEGEESDDDAGHDERTADGDGEEPTLAETARPRADTGWHDLSDIPSNWTLDPAPTGEDDGFTDAAVQATEPDPDAFSALLGDDADANDGFMPDDEPLAPTREPDPPFQTDSGALGDVIDDLIGDLGPAPATPDEAGDDPLAALDDALAGLDQFEDIGAATPDAVEAAPTEEPAAREAPTAAPAPEAPAPPDLAAMPPPSSRPAPAPDDLLAAAPPPALPDATTGPDAADGGAPEERPADPAPEDDEAATAAAAPEPEDDPEPGPAPQGMNFASKPKKRGLFGR